MIYISSIFHILFFSELYVPIDLKIIRFIFKMIKKTLESDSSDLYVLVFMFIRVRTSYIDFIKGESMSRKLSKKIKISQIS